MSALLPNKNLTRGKSRDKNPRLASASPAALENRAEGALDFASYMEFVVVEHSPQLLERQRVELWACGPHHFEVSHYKTECLIAQLLVAFAHGQLVGTYAVAHFQALS